QHFFKYRLKYMSALCQRSMAIIRPVEQKLRKLVHHHISRPGIKSRHVFRPGIGGNGGEISDAAEVLHNAPDATVSENDVIKKRNQRRAFAADSHVRRTKIRNRRYSQPRSDDRAFSCLPGTSNLLAQIKSRVALVVNSLAMTADQVNVGDGGVLLRFANGIGVKFSQQEVQPRKLRHADAGGIHGPEHRLLHPWGVREVLMAE